MSAWKSTGKSPLEIARFDLANLNLLKKEEIGFRQSDFGCTKPQHRLDLLRIDLEVARLLLWHGEPLVESQLFAQHEAPDSIVFPLG